mgnify:FL=1
MKTFIILTPVYNDWESLNKLLKKINDEAERNDFGFEVLVVNDSSKINADINFIKTKNIISLNILNLSKNIGSQRAIALGLEYLFEFKKNKASDIIIMDSDGQDAPEILKNLISANENSDSDITVVERTNRNEPFWFQFFYFLHKKVLFIFTGKHIKFGNFSLIRSKELKNLVNKADLWAAYPAAVVNNLKKIDRIKSDRKKRYSGETKMNLKKLFYHSSRVFSVFKTKIFIISVIYALIISIFFKNNAEISYFLIFSLLMANIYNVYISLINKNDFKKKSDGPELKIKKIF